MPGGDFHLAKSGDFEMAIDTQRNGPETVTTTINLRAIKWIETGCRG